MTTLLIKYYNLLEKSIKIFDTEGVLSNKMIKLTYYCYIPYIKLIIFISITVIILI